MVTERINLEPEVQRVFECIDLKENFLLSGGAGSGKTYSLIKIIDQILAETPTAQIACITYTNSAVKTIKNRFSSKNLSVSTIHEFLWDNIKSFQKELKEVLLGLINDETVKKIRHPDGEIPDDYLTEKDIQYKEYLRIRDGIISHDELIILANRMFENYPKLCDILKSKFDFIFIDEYQDTSLDVVQILLEYLKQSDRSNTIGFFGDAMQSIYSGSIGDLESYTASADVKEIPKEQNRRNPKSVIDLANILRVDSIHQVPSGDENAPNMQDSVIKNGSVKFYYSLSEEKLDFLKEKIGWDFTNAKETKILNLTHNLIAPQAGFTKLMNIYDGDKILSYRDRVKGFIKDNNITEDFSGDTFEQVIERLREGKTSAELKKILPTKGMQDFIDNNPALYKQAKNYLFEEFKKIYVDKETLLDDKKDDADDES